MQGKRRIFWIQTGIFHNSPDCLANADVRKIVKEHQIESEITEILHKKFSFRYILLEDEQNNGIDPSRK